MGATPENLKAPKMVERLLSGLSGFYMKKEVFLNFLLSDEFRNP